MRPASTRFGLEHSASRHVPCQHVVPMHSHGGKIARVPTTDGGTAWFKAVFPPFKAEVSITRFLDAAIPDAVPHVIAADGDAGRLLLDDVGGEPVGSTATDDQMAAAICRLVQI